jgi:hypothetical protein
LVVGVVGCVGKWNAQKKLILFIFGLLALLGIWEGECPEELIFFLLLLASSGVWEGSEEVDFVFVLVSLVGYVGRWMPRRSSFLLLLL